MNSVFQPYSYYVKTYERYKWDKYQHRPANTHVEEGEEKEGEYIKKGGKQERGIENSQEKIL